jgi:hypothetical protein
MNLRQDQATGTGDICGTGDDNSYAVVEELRMTFPHTGSFNPEAIDEVPLRDEQKWMGKPLEYAKVSRATRKLANGRPGGNAELYGVPYKAFDKDPETRVFLKEVLGGFWKSESLPDGESRRDRPRRWSPRSLFGVRGSGQSAICRQARSGPCLAGCR